MTTETTTESSELKELAEFEQKLIAELDANATAEDQALLEQGGILPTEPPAPSQPPAPTPPAPAPAPAVSTQPPSPAPTQAPPAPAAAPTPPTEAPAPKPEGDPRAALRASRHQERLLRDRVKDLEMQLQAAAAGKAPAPSGEPDDIEAVIARAEADFPEIGKAMRVMSDKLQKLTASAPPPPAPEPDFVPEVIADPALQAAVDDVPALSDWQHLPQYQQHWQLAKVTDGLLLNLPRWKNAPVHDRLQEVVRRVNAELGSAGTPPPPPPPPDPAAAIRDAVARAPTRAPETLSDVRGGVPPTHSEPNFHAMASDEEVMAALNRISG